MLERLKVEVRLREPMEAVDLGFHLLRAHLGAVYRPWLLVLTALALPLYLVFPRHPWVAPLVLWWLQPVLDRIVLDVLARAQFGETPNLAATLRALPAMLRHGTLAGLLWRRLSPQRSVLLPLWQLEEQDGPGFRSRAALILRRSRGTAQLLTLAFVNFELGLQVSALVAIQLFVPKGSDFNVFSAVFEPDPGRGWTLLLPWVLPVLAVALLEPFYVAGGFSLYLNRRIQLEGWDLELVFRRVARSIVSLGLLLACLGGPLLAGEPTPARKALEEVLKAPEFQTHHKGRELRWKRKAEPRKPQQPSDLRWVEKLGKILALASKWILISLASAAVLFVLWKYRTTLRRALARVPEEPLPDQLFGMDLRPEHLPADLPEAARRLWLEGDVRGALGLLYRGALSCLVHSHHLRVPTGATEGDCLRLARERLGEDARDFFRHLTRAWERAAYGHLPPLEGSEGLLNQWSLHFHTRGRP